MNDTAISAANTDFSRLALAKLGSRDLLGKGGLRLTSPAFAEGGELDPCFTADEEDAVAPPMEWTKPPPGTQEMVIIVEDPSGSGSEPTCHWLVWGLSPQQGKLLEGEAPPRVGKNAVGNSEWLLPSLPEGDPPHTFVFQLFALDLPLVEMPGIDRSTLIDAMAGHVLSAAMLTATYQRREGDDEDGWDDNEFELE